MNASPPSLTEAGGEVREQILDAAGLRFERYGFGKTTMAEIAGDCGMSAANLYRYFASKEEIAVEGSARWLAETEHLLAEAGRGPGTGRERLHRIVRTRLERVAELVARHPHLDELVESVCAKRSDLLAEHLKAVAAVIAAAIEAGQATGEFRALDTGRAAMAIVLATTRFAHHTLVRTGRMEELARDLQDVVDLLIDGLAQS